MTLSLFEVVWTNRKAVMLATVMSPVVTKNGTPASTKENPCKDTAGLETTEITSPATTNALAVIEESSEEIPSAAQ